jgi:hypothetical protein
MISRGRAYHNPLPLGEGGVWGLAYDSATVPLWYTNYRPFVVAHAVRPATATSEESNHGILRRLL